MNSSESYPPMSGQLYIQSQSSWNRHMYQYWITKYRLEQELEAVLADENSDLLELRRLALAYYHHCEAYESRNVTSQKTFNA